MNTVTLSLTSKEAFCARGIAAMKGELQGAFVSFMSPDLLWQILTPMLWNIVKVMTRAGPLSIEEVSRRLACDVGDVREDVDQMVSAGLLDRNEDGSIEFLYDAIHVDFWLRVPTASSVGVVIDDWAA